jgi:hypothetical protein
MLAGFCRGGAHRHDMTVYLGFFGRRDVRLSLGFSFADSPAQRGSHKRAPDQGFRVRCAGWI